MQNLKPIFVSLLLTAVFMNLNQTAVLAMSEKEGINAVTAVHNNAAGERIAKSQASLNEQKSTLTNEEAQELARNLAANSRGLQSLDSMDSSASKMALFNHLKNLLSQGVDLTSSDYLGLLQTLDNSTLKALGVNNYAQLESPGYPSLTRGELEDLANQLIQGGYESMSQTERSSLVISLTQDPKYRAFFPGFLLPSEIEDKANQIIAKFSTLKKYEAQAEAQKKEENNENSDTEENSENPLDLDGSITSVGRYTSGNTKTPLGEKIETTTTIDTSSIQNEEINSATKQGTGYEEMLPE